MNALADAFRYEIARIRTIRSTWWLTGLALVVGVGITTLMGWAIHHEFSTHGVSEGDLDGLGPIVVTQLAATGQVPSVVAFLMAMIGIFAWGHEYRHGMIRASLTALRSMRTGSPRPCSGPASTLSIREETMRSMAILPSAAWFCRSSSRGPVHSAAASRAATGSLRGSAGSP